MFQEYNPNPLHKQVGDCAVRAISKALDISWDKAFAIMTIKAFIIADLPSANSVWGSVLKDHGFSKEIIIDECTAEEFCNANSKGIFVLGFGNHVATAIDGTIYDSWNSTQEIPQYYWYKKGE